MNATSTGNKNTENEPMDQTEDSKKDQKERDNTDTVSYPTVPKKEDINRSLKEAEGHYVYFWKQEDALSQWHHSSFEVDGRKYCCAEQYMMYTKAVLLHNDQLAVKILKCSDPWRIKSLGRKTEQFSVDLWVHNCLHVVKTGNRAKFSQNEKLKERLFSTYPHVLVEASPYDKVWGIALSKHEPCAWNEATWEGKNLLGFILTEVRDELMCEHGIIKERHKKAYFEKLSDDLKKNGLMYKHDKPGRRNYREESSSKYQHSCKELSEKQTSEVTDIVGASSHPVTISDQSTENIVDKNQAEDNATRRREGFSSYQSVGKDEMRSENSAGEKIAITEIATEQGQQSSEEGRRDMINKNEIPRHCNQPETSSRENFQESMNPQDRLYKPEYRASIEVNEDEDTV